MKININQITGTWEVPVWRGKIENGYIVRNGNIDLVASKKRYNYFWGIRQAIKEGRM